MHHNVLQMITIPHIALLFVSASSPESLSQAKEYYFQKMQMVKLKFLVVTGLTDDFGDL